MEQSPSPQKWEAKVSTLLQSATADQIWLNFQDFFGLDKWFPGLPTCYGIHGSNGEPGCIRHCSGFNLPPADGGPGPSWSRERLVSIDHGERTLCYEIVDCNIGFKSYVSTVKVVPVGNGSMIEWQISLDPVAGFRFDDLVNNYEVGLKLMAEKMESDLSM